MTAASLLEKTSKVTLPPPFLWSRNMQNAIKAEIKKLAKRAFAKKAKSKKQENTLDHSMLGYWIFYSGCRSRRKFRRWIRE
jgi:hypothetical protein